MRDFSAVSAALGSNEPWVIERLERFARLIAHPRYRESSEVEAELVASAHYLQDWLPIYRLAYEVIGEDPPEFVGDILLLLEDLIPFLETNLILSIDTSKGGPKPDRRKWLCATVCGQIWREVHGVAQPYSTGLWDACESYWLACGHVGEDPIHWEHYLTRPR